MCTIPTPEVLKFHWNIKMSCFLTLLPSCLYHWPIRRRPSRSPLLSVLLLMQDYLIWTCETACVLHRSQEPESSFHKDFKPKSTPEEQTQHVRIGNADQNTTTVCRYNRERNVTASYIRSQIQRWPGILVWFPSMFQQYVWWFSTWVQCSEPHFLMLLWLGSVCQSPVHPFLV